MKRTTALLTVALVTLVSASLLFYFGHGIFAPVAMIVSGFLFFILIGATTV